MTEDDLCAIEARCCAATDIIEAEVNQEGMYPGSYLALIASADDIPALIAEVRMLRAALDASSSHIKWLENVIVEYGNNIQAIKAALEGR